MTPANCLSAKLLQSDIFCQVTYVANLFIFQILGLRKHAAQENTAIGNLFIRYSAEKFEFSNASYLQLMIFFCLFVCYTSTVCLNVWSVRTSSQFKRKSRLFWQKSVFTTYRGWPDSPFPYIFIHFRTFHFHIFPFQITDRSHHLRLA